MNRPGGNVTGVSRLSVTLEPKRLEFLRELVPKATVIGFLVNPTNPRSELVVQQMEEAAPCALHPGLGCVSDSAPTRRTRSTCCARAASSSRSSAAWPLAGWAEHAKNSGEKQVIVGQRKTQQKAASSESAFRSRRPDSIPARLPI
jgi:hypothetical protein